MTITRPTGMVFLDWASCTVQDLSEFGIIGGPQSEVKWQEWAIQISNNSSINGVLPDPYGFSTWQEWAERLCATIG